MFADLRYAARMLVKSPGFTAVALLSLALGIGANTAIFSIVNALLFRPMPVERPEELVALFTTDERNPGNLPMSHLNFKDYRAQGEVLSDVAAFTFAAVNYSAPGGEAEQLQAQVVSGNYFDVLGVRPPLGRAFLPEEDRVPGAHPVVVVSHGFWENSLGSDAAAIGRTLVINRHPFTIVGVAPRGFTGVFLGGGPALWVPMMMHDVVQPGFTWYEERRGLFLVPFGRLKPEVALEQARASLGVLAAHLEREYPTENQGRGVQVMPLLEARIDPNGQGQLARLSLLLMIVVGIVLLIACANIANLLLARAAKRRREVAVRVALGANRSRLVRQLLTESVLLGLLGGAAGLLLATWTLALLEGINVPLPVPLGEVAVLEPRVLAYTIGLALLTGLIFGLVPALQASRTDVVGVLKNELVPSGRYRGLTMRKALVVSQVALSLVALIAAGLFLRSLRQAEAVEPGFETDRVLVMSFNLGREGYTPERGLLFYQEVAERTAGLPAVRSAAVAQNSPFTGGFSRSVFFEHDDTTTRDRVLIQRTAVTPGYFEAMGIPIVRGRDFTRQDRDGSVPVAIINETMADRFFAGPDPVGRRLKFFGDDHFTEIIGVARNSKYNQLIEEPIPFIYEALLQNYAPDASLIVRTGTDAATLVGPVREEVRRIDPSLAVFNAQPLRVQVEGTLAPQRVQVTLLSVFGLLALGLAAVGIYGVTSYAVSQRTREIGVRMALGARRGDVLRLVLGQGLLLVGLGLAIGFGAAWAVSLLAANLLFNVSATDPATFVGTALALGLVALAASYLPALRATRVDPLLALRSE